MRGMHRGDMEALRVCPVQSSDRPHVDKLLHSLPFCGQTFCRQCLTHWFSMPGSRLDAHGALRPIYVCPLCRQNVSSLPRQNISLKRLVQLAADARGESNPQRPQSPLRGRGGGS